MVRDRENHPCCTGWNDRNRSHTPTVLAIFAQSMTLSPDQRYL